MPAPPGAARPGARAARGARRACPRPPAPERAGRLGGDRSRSARRCPAPARCPTTRDARRVHGAWTRTRRRLPARQAGGEDPARGHRGDPAGHRPLAAGRPTSPAVGLPADVAARWPWNRRSRPDSPGGEHRRDARGRRPELPDARPRAAGAARARASRPTTSPQLWLDNLPAGRIFTAERAAYRNLLDARPAARDGDARATRSASGSARSIRTDVLRLGPPGRRPAAAARWRWADARLSHTAQRRLRGDVGGGAAPPRRWSRRRSRRCSTPPGRVLPAGQPDRRAPCGSAPRARPAEGRDVERAASTRCTPRTGTCTGCTCSTTRRVIAFALARRATATSGRSVSIAVTAGWDTDSAGATVGGVVGRSARARRDRCGVDRAAATAASHLAAGRRAAHRRPRGPDGRARHTEPGAEPEGHA